MGIGLRRNVLALVFGQAVRLAAFSLQSEAPCNSATAQLSSTYSNYGPVAQVDRAAVS